MGRARGSRATRNSGSLCHYKAIIVLVSLLTLILGWFALRIERRVELEENLPRSNRRLAVFHEFRAQYGSGSSVAVILSGRDVFSRNSLAAIDRLTDALLDVAGVKSVASLTNLTEFQGDGEAIRSGPVLAKLPADPSESAALRERILSDPWYKGRLVSADGRSTMIVVTLAKAGALEEALAVLARVRDCVKATAGSGFAVDLAGSLVMDEQINRALGRDVTVLFPLVLLVIAAVLFLSFRSLQGVVLPLATVAVSVVWTLGVMSLLRRPLSLVNNIMPVLLIGVGSAYGIHVVARFREQIAGGRDRAEAVRQTIEGTGFGVWMAALTTIAGFGSLALSKIRMIFDFGVFSALGVALAFIAAITFIPVLLAALPPPRLRPDNPGGNRAGGLLGRCARLIAVHPLVMLAVAGFVAAAAVAGWPRLTTTFEPAQFLPPVSEHHRAEALVDAKFGGSAELEILVGGDLSDGDVLRRIQLFQERLRGLEVSQPISIVDLLARMNKAFHGGDPAYERLPRDEGALPQFLFLLTMSTSPEELGQFVNFDQTEARISARISNVMSTVERTRLIAAVEREADDIFGPDAKVRVTGMPVIELAMMDIIRDEQLQNIYSSLGAVLILVVLAFRSLAAGVLCVTPIALTIAASFGLMGWVGVPLNAATVTMASLATGMGIDYSIHFHRRYREENSAGLNIDAALARTAATTGVSIVTNALAVAAGFGILAVSGLPIFRSFGTLVAMTMILTALGALTVLPALIKVRARLNPHSRSPRPRDRGERE